ncbi:MAG: hypothetical protein CL946_07520 [Ectothiorhodospiraceae bacterium]|nr:hypothetical protein [Ectothiorhodospiraceae bacterium]
MINRLLYLFLFLFVGSQAVAQYRMQHQPAETPAAPYESDILSARPIRYFIGVGLGALAYQHLGEFTPYPSICQCVFSDQDDLQFHYAGELSIQYPKLGFGVKLLVQYVDFSSRFAYQETRMAVVVEDEPAVEALFEKSSDVELEYLTFTPMFAWYIPRSPVFLIGGPEVGITMNAQYDNIERILSPEGYDYYTGEDPFQYDFLKKSDIPESSGVRLGLHLGIGVDLEITRRFFITPQFGATLPLTPVSSTHEDWNVGTEYGLILFRYRL